MFTPLPEKPDHPGLELEILDLLGARGHLRQAAWADPRRREVELRRRPGDGEQEAAGPHGLGSDAQGRLPALQGAARLRPALPERLRLPGPLDRGRGREVARPQLEARDRGVRTRPLHARVHGCRRALHRRADARLDPARPVDGLGQRLRDVLGHEHRVHLAVPRSSSTSGAGCTSATARPTGAHAVARRSPSTSSRSPASTRSVPTRRSMSACRSSSAAASPSSSGRRRPGRCPRTLPPLCGPGPSTG